MCIGGMFAVVHVKTEMKGDSFITMVITDWIAVFIQFWSTTKKPLHPLKFLYALLSGQSEGCGSDLFRSLFLLIWDVRRFVVVVFFCCHYCYMITAAAAAVVASSFTIVIVTVTDRVLLVDFLHSILMFYPNVTLNVIAVVFILLLFFSHSMGICSYSKILLKLPERPHVSGPVQIVSVYLFYYSCLFTWNWSLEMSGGCNNIWG